jgi:hypothetical protein
MSLEYSLVTRQIRWAQLHLGYQEAGMEPKPDRVGTQYCVALNGTYTQESISGYPICLPPEGERRQKGREGGKERNSRTTTLLECRQADQRRRLRITSCVKSKLWSLRWWHLLFLAKVQIQTHSNKVRRVVCLGTWHFCGFPKTSTLACSFSYISMHPIIFPPTMTDAGNWD